MVLYQSPSTWWDSVWYLWRPAYVFHTSWTVASIRYLHLSQGITHWEVSYIIHQWKANFLYVHYFFDVHHIPHGRSTLPLILRRCRVGALFKCGLLNLLSGRRIFFRLLSILAVKIAWVFTWILTWYKININKLNII